MKKIVFLFCLLVPVLLHAQDSLPNFKVSEVGNGHVVVSWNNPYPNLVTISVQRSYDSVKRFSTLYSAPSPNLPTNGFADKVAPGIKVYYRLFYVMEGGAYFFSKTKSPGIYTGDGTAGNTVEDNSRRDVLFPELLSIINGYDDTTAKPFTITIHADENYRRLSYNQFLDFRRNLLTTTLDTLVQTGKDSVAILKYIRPVEIAEKPSEYIFTNKQGYVVVKLPFDYRSQTYKVVFYNSIRQPILELKDLKDSPITLDKTSFYRSGWYNFEIFQNGRVIEKNKVYLAPEF